MSRAKAKAPSDLDLHNAALLASAVSFTASIFAYGRKNTIPFATVEEARAMAEKMTAAVDNGRRACVYGVTAEGASVLIP